MGRLILMTLFVLEKGLPAQCPGILVENGQLIARGGPYTGTVTLGDVDQDGDLDLIAANANQPDSVYLNDGNGTFTDSGQTLGPPHTGDTKALVLADFNQDGALDLVVGSFNGQPNLIFLNDNDGSGNFSTSEVLGVTGPPSALADLDLIVGNYQQPDQVHFNHGIGTFVNSLQQLGQSLNSIAMTLGDIDSDNDLDLVVGCWQGRGIASSATKRGPAITTTTASTMPWTSHREPRKTPTVTACRTNAKAVKSR